MLTDFCNECGNCATFCPTSGEPYRDKPRLYLDRADFEAQQDNAFMLLADGSIEARWAGQTHQLSVDAEVVYRSPSISARFTPQRFELLEATVRDASLDGEVVHLDRAADMYVLLRGLEGSMGHLPRAVIDAGGGTRVSPPVYPE